MLDNGWLPKQLPRSATGIEEAHSIDSGEIWGAFNFEPGGIYLLVAECAPNQNVRLPDAKKSARSAPWWRRTLVAGSGPGGGDKSLSLYSCPQMNHAGSVLSAGFAVDREANLAMYWVAK